jgi:hypothetical protein
MAYGHIFVGWQDRIYQSLSFLIRINLRNVMKKCGKLKSKEYFTTYLEVVVLV